jgi:hypothetical protein
MRSILGSLAGMMAAVLVLGAPAGAADRCTQDQLVVDGIALATTMCVPAPENGHVEVSETYVHGDVTITRTLAIDMVSGATIARALDDVPLDLLGSTKRLRVTLAYSNGLASLEHALVLPGALVLK